MLRTTLYFVALLVCVRICQCLHIIDFQDYCGGTIRKNAGELRFDEQKLFSLLPQLVCTVSISLHGDSNTQILFYFTSFDLATFCDFANVTIFDGFMHNGTRIQGLPAYLCGSNKTLEEPGRFFETQSNRLTITFRRSNNGRKLSGIFNIKYVEFHTGECEGSNEFKCVNGHCFPNEYHCSDEIYACESEDCTDNSERGQTFVESLLDFIKSAAIVFAVLICLALVTLVIKRFNLLQKLQAWHTPTEERRLSARRHSVLLQSLPTDDIQVSTEEVQPSVQPSAPPPNDDGEMLPSYNDVISKASLPSYNDVISNPDAFK